ncbi:MAG: ABC transporter permease [Bacteroidaceae bacterium]|nr:ABC transporter permease [Bacteroidaceae bacterium]
MLDNIKNILKDQAVMLFVVIVPLVYPLLYSFIYTNEVTRDIPVCIVDLCNSSTSREFARRFDATPEVAVAYRVGSLSEAERLMQEQKIHGILYLPTDFDTRLGTMQQSTVSLYCDMGFMLYYKAVYLAANNVMLSFKHPLLAANPDVIRVREVEMFNWTDGYGNFILQAVFPLLIQQVLVIAICTVSGTRRQRGLPEVTLKKSLGLAVAFYALFLIMSAYVMLVVPQFFSFTQMITVRKFLTFVFPMLFGYTCFAMFLSLFFRDRESPLLCIAFTSIPLLFMTGATWPVESMPRVWQTFAWVFPSTPAVKAFMRMNAMGAEVWMIKEYLWIVMVQGVAYLGLFLVLRKLLYRNSVNLKLQ